MLHVEHVSTQQQKDDAFAVRKLVFVDEQQVPLEEEIDQHEEHSEHFVLYNGETPVGAGRFRSVDSKGKFERICVLSSHRGNGSGALLMTEIEKYAVKNGYTTLKLNAQTHALSFYEKLGYHITSDEFLDAGIPHKSMEKHM